MKKACVLLVALFFSCCCFGCSEESFEKIFSDYDPETVVRLSCFENDFDEEFGWQKDSNMGMIIKTFTMDTLVKTSYNDGKYYWTEEWTVNGDIPNLEKLITYGLGYNAEKEDLVCITITEQGDPYPIGDSYLFEGETSYSMVFSVEKESHTVKPVLLFFADYGEFDEDDIIMSEDFSLTSFFELIKYALKDIHTFRNNVYGMYN